MSQKQMIVTVPEDLLQDMGEVAEATRNSVFKGCSSFLKGESEVIILPDTFSYTIKEIDSDISEVVLTIDKGEK